MPKNYLDALRRRIAPPAILAHLDDPAGPVVRTDRRRLPFRGWAVAPGGADVGVRIVSGDRVLAEAECRQARGDVFARHHRRFGLRDPFCGFETEVDLFEFFTGERAACRVEFRSGDAATTAGPIRIILAPEIPHARGQYKEVWNTGTDDLEHARLVIAGHADDDVWLATARAASQHLVDTVGVGASDVVLEIGCGVGRVGSVLAPLCREWIGADVSERMLEHMSRRLAHLPNVRPLPLNGYDLRNVPADSIDLVYSTIVFLHLEDWERFRYVREGLRVLRPGGRMMVDVCNVLSDRGWEIFMENDDFYHPRVRPPSVGRGATPQEMENYFRRAGFEEIRQSLVEPFVFTWGRKPLAAPSDS